MATREPAERKPYAMQSAVTLQRADRIFRAARMEAAACADERAHAQAIGPNEPDQELRHKSRRSASCASGRRVAAFFKINTKSSGGRADRFRRKRSRRIRLTALRLTALGATLRLTAMPSLGTPTRFGRKRSSSHFPCSELRARDTATYCSRVRSLALFGRASPERSLHRQAMAAFSATGADHCLASSRSHADEKTVAAFAPSNRRLVRPLHALMDAV
jgi:hypothetical protein